MSKDELTELVAAVFVKIDRIQRAQRIDATAAKLFSLAIMRGVSYPNEMADAAATAYAQAQALEAARPHDLDNLPPF